MPVARPLAGLVRRRFLAVLAIVTLGVSVGASPASAHGGSFTIAVIPDTQNYADYTHQTEAGFPFDAREMLFAQMRYIAGRAVSRGGDVVFATAVGDVWQHPSLAFDLGHARYGLSAVRNPLLESHLAPAEETRTVETPIGRRAYEILDGVLPFSVVPGNHDYDAQWTDSRYPPVADLSTAGDHPLPYGLLHPGGLNNWLSVFAQDGPFFRDRPWYVGAYNGGADSAQVFLAGGYRFLHIGLEMAPSDDVLAWASEMIARHPGLPTIVTTHDHLNVRAEQAPNPTVDLALAHPEHNNPDQVWKKFLSRHDQILMVLSGHQHGQAYRVDETAGGFKVHQLLSDFQDRNQAAITAGWPSSWPPTGVGDGWMRLMTFDLDAEIPTVRIRTYSTHYEAYSTELPTYAEWYKPREQPTLTDAEFLARDDFTIPLDDFHARFARTPPD